jgi:hypothetical protein
LKLGKGFGAISWFVAGSRVARFSSLKHTKTGKNIPNDHKIYKMATKYTKWPYNRPTASKEPQQSIQIGIFGLKIYHLAALAGSRLRPEHA